MALPQAIPIFGQIEDTSVQVSHLCSPGGCHIWPRPQAAALIADYSEGGYKIVDIKSKLMSLKLIWIKRLLDDNFHARNDLDKIFLILLSGASMFHSNLSLSDVVLVH